jgi:GrpB-like predicted nucleotidyltransferase (UPF0157 family)
MAQTYSAAAIGVAFGNNKSMLAVFNGVGSGRIIRVYRVWVLNNQTAGVTGVLTTWELKRSSAQSAGTAITPTKHDTASESMPAQVAVATGGTVTQTGDVALRRWMWSNDEPAASSASSDELECLVPLNCVWDSTGDSNIEPITLREGQGLDVRHSGSTAVGIVDVFVEFTLAAT